MLSGAVVKVFKSLLECSKGTLNKIASDAVSHVVVTAIQGKGNEIHLWRYLK